MQPLNKAIPRFDKWVSRHGGYVPPDFIPGDDPHFGVQQVREEILTFVDVLEAMNLHGTILEIGLGHHGGTHILWREIFKKVVTLEADKHLVWRFRLREGLKARHIVIGNCHLPDVVAKARTIASSIDCLFIDGGHSYEAVTLDWELYHDLVRPNGIVAFHDSVSPFGVPRVLRELARDYAISNIVHSANVGIAWIKV